MPLARGLLFVGVAAIWYGCCFGFLSFADATALPNAASPLWSRTPALNSTSAASRSRNINDKVLKEKKNIKQMSLLISIIFFALALIVIALAALQSWLQLFFSKADARRRQDTIGRLLTTTARFHHLSLAGEDTHAPGEALTLPPSHWNCSTSYREIHVDRGLCHPPTSVRQSETTRAGRRTDRHLDSHSKMKELSSLAPRTTEDGRLHELDLLDTPSPHPTLSLPTQSLEAESLANISAFVVSYLIGGSLVKSRRGRTALMQPAKAKSILLNRFSSGYSSIRKLRLALRGPLMPYSVTTTSIPFDEVAGDSVADTVKHNATRAAEATPNKMSVGNLDVFAAASTSQVCRDESAGCSGNLSFSLPLIHSESHMSQLTPRTLSERHFDPHCGGKSPHLSSRFHGTLPLLPRHSPLRSNSYSLPSLMDTAADSRGDSLIHVLEVDHDGEIGSWTSDERSEFSRFRSTCRGAQFCSSHNPNAAASPKASVAEPSQLVAEQQAEE